MIVLVDCDGVLCDFVGGVCKAVESFGLYLTPENVTSYDFRDCLSPEQLEIVDELSRTEGFCSRLQWYPGAREALRRLQYFADVRVVTQPWKSGTWIQERLSWLAPVVDPKKVIFTYDKSIIFGDALVEDNPANTRLWKERNIGMACIIDQPWNQDVALTRASVYRSFEQCVDALAAR